jgi:hypothetical protein
MLPLSANTGPVRVRDREGAWQEQKISQAANNSAIEVNR